MYKSLFHKNIFINYRLTLQHMNKHYLMSKMKSSGIAYLCWFFLGCHYAYLGKWGLQILFWITFGGVGIWAFIDLFLIPSKVNSHNLLLAHEIDRIEKREKEESHVRDMAMLSAIANNSQQNSIQKTE